MTKKQCQMCKLTQPILNFHRSGRTKDGRSSYCSSCKVQTNKNSELRRIDRNREAFLDQRKGWHIKHTYGITLDEYKGMRPRIEITGIDHSSSSTCELASPRVTAYND